MAFDFLDAFLPLPKKSKTCVLLTRPYEDSLKLQKGLQAEGIQSIISPVLKIVHRVLSSQEAALLERPSWAGLILTSRHAVQALEERGIPTNTLLFVVGTSTQEACVTAGFHKIIVAENSAESLFHLLDEHFCQEREDVKEQGQELGASSRPALLYLRGQEIRLDLVSAMKEKGLDVEQLVIYDAQAITSLTQEAIEALQKEEATDVVFYSARSATLFYEAVEAVGLKGQGASLRVHGLSPAIFEAAQLAQKDKIILKKGAQIEYTCST